MESPVSLFLYSGFALLLALLVSWLYVRFGRLLRERRDPSPGSILRLRASGGVYRSQILALGADAWRISAPLQRDCFVPLRQGEDVVIEAACEGGALVFRTQILDRCLDDHTLLVGRPATIHRIERREHPRWREFAGEKLDIEGCAGRIIDLAAGGARIQSVYRACKGERVKLDMPWKETLYGWVLSREGDETRVRFEELTVSRRL